MANNDFIVDFNRDLLLKQNQYLEPGQSHSEVFDHVHNFGLTHMNDQNLYAELVNKYGQDLCLGHSEGHKLAVNDTNDHDLGPQHTDIGKYEENGFHEAEDSNADQDGDDHEKHLVHGFHMAQDQGLYLPENHESPIKEFHNFHENSGSAVNQNPEIGTDTTSDVNVQQPLLIIPHIPQSRSLIPVSSHELSMGQQFPDVHSCRRAIREAAISHHFEMHTIKSDKTRYTAKCASEGCPWRIHAAKLPGVPTFTIRTIHGDHTCGGIEHLGHQQASVQWVADCMEQQLRENPHYKPKEILEEIHRVHGIALSYKQAWRAKERFMETVRGSFEEEYRLLPQYCDWVRKVNPGSIAVVYGNPLDCCFERLFISFQASIYGFLNACRPLIGLDGTVLKSKYLGTLLFATGFDGDGVVFPLAFGVVGEENNDNWLWFLSVLHNLLEANTENMPKLTILSDRRQAIVDGVEASFPTAFHGFCMRHLIDCFSKDFNNPLLNNLFWQAANALTVIEFQQKILEIEEMSPEAACWIRAIDHRLWATAYFEGTRLGQLTANIIESLNTLITEASGLPIIQMMEHIRRQLMIWFNKRLETSMQWTGILIPSARKQVSDAIERAHTYQVLRAGDAEFEVISDEGSHIVNIRSRQCLCHGWQLCGLPCAHAVAVLNFCRQDVYRFAESCFTVTNYRKAYSQTIHPIPDKALWREMSVNEEDHKEIELIINPPKLLQQPPGRPRKRQTRHKDGEKKKRAVHCSRCNQTGHFRTTCTVPF